jgi:type II secretory pathway pseudopilin PulG
MRFSFCVSTRTRTNGFTLAEALIAVGIVLALAVLLFSVTPGLLQRFSKARCISNLRSLHVAFSAYVSDNQHWPQAPKSVSGNGQTYEQWWMATMDPYTDSRGVWQCPVLKAGKIADASGKPVLMHYVPTQFDAAKASPYRWSTQPWLIEMGNAHGDGGLILFPDGRVESLGMILRSRLK